MKLRNDKETWQSNMTWQHDIMTWHGTRVSQDFQNAIWIYSLKRIRPKPLIFNTVCLISWPLEVRLCYRLLCLNCGSKTLVLNTINPTSQAIWFWPLALWKNIFGAGSLRISIILYRKTLISAGLYIHMTFWKFWLTLTWHN